MLTVEHFNGAHYFLSVPLSIPWISYLIFLAPPPIEWS